MNNPALHSGTHAGFGLSLEDRLGIRREREPVTLGVPFPRGEVKDGSEITLVDEKGRQVPVQVEVLDRWSDGTAKWALLDFLASVPGSRPGKYLVKTGSPALSPESGEMPVRRNGSRIEVDTGACTFLLDGERFLPILSVKGTETPNPEFTGSRTVLRGVSGVEYEPFVDTVNIETTGRIRTTVKFQGGFSEAIARKADRFCDFQCRLSFFRGKSLVRMEFTIWNPSAAKHRGGVWDLGDRGSVFFRELSFFFGVAATGKTVIRWKPEPSRPWAQSETGPLEIYQDSSGGPNWNSTNHVNRFGRITTSFCGYRVSEDGKIVSDGRRASPIVLVETQGKRLQASVPHFWQNFPKSLKTEDGGIRIGIFPDRREDPYELQGGERKTHAIYLDFDSGEGNGEGLEWVHEPLVPVVDPGYVSGTGAFPYLVPWEKDPNDRYKALVSEAVSGERSFFSRREIIDEYGWRNFGDLYADHEAVYYKGRQPPVSHYNNQYDGIRGSLLQYARSGVTDWFLLGQDIARHVMDIDIYHTKSDKAAFNGGMFWHTDHYSDAATATHRTYSRLTREVRNLKQYGGGPSNEHLYTTGLLYLHFLTGSAQAREAVVGLADWVLAMEDGARTPFRLFCSGETGLASKTAEMDYHGPGRGAGNSINALMDAHVVTRKREYLEFAERLIRRCIHPEDDVPGRNLLDHEMRWSYTVFLQYLGKYLDLKLEHGEQDYMFHYARESLLRYADWMMEHEIPFRRSLDRVEYPTETWIVHDLRKSNVLEFAARFSKGERRERYLQKARFFFDGCFRDLEDFETRALTRPLVIMMSCGVMHSHFQNHPETRVEESPHAFDFGRPAIFRAQRTVAMGRARMIVGAGAVLTGLIGVWLVLS